MVVPVDILVTARMFLHQTDIDPLAWARTHACNARTTNASMHAHRWANHDGVDELWHAHVLDHLALVVVAQVLSVVLRQVGQLVAGLHLRRQVVTGDAAREAESKWAPGLHTVHIFPMHKAPPKWAPGFEHSPHIAHA